MHVLSTFWQAVAKYTEPHAMLLQQAKAADRRLCYTFVSLKYLLPMKHQHKKGDVPVVV